MILFPQKNIYAQAIIFNTSFILYFLPINQSLSHIIQFYGKGYHFALISLERFGILLGFHLLFGNISAECGFSSRSYLYRIFKEKEGCSPTVWRAKIQ